MRPCYPVSWSSVHLGVDGSTLAGDAVCMAEQYTIRTDDGEIEVADLDSLVALARQGRIGRATPVRFEDSDWGPAERIPEVAEVLTRDPWSAWQGAEDDADELLKAFERPAAPEQPISQAPAGPGVEDLPASAVVPMEDAAPAPAQVPPSMAPPATSTVRRPAGEVIEFPQDLLPQSSGPHALDFKPTPRPRRAPDKVQATKPSGLWSQINWLRMALIAGVAIGGTSTAVWYVHTVSGSQFVHRPPKIVLPAAPVTEQVRVPIPPVSPFASMEQTLRDQLMEGILDICGEEPFEVALLIELRRVRLDVAWARVKIESWAGRNKDIPENVRFQVRIRARGDGLDRDLGALGLVLGKYIQHYGLEAQEIEVLLEDESGTVRQTQIHPDSARRLFTHRMSLEEFLGKAFQAAP